MSVAWYRSTAAESAARAGSCWPVVAYSMPRLWTVGLERAHAQFFGEGEGLLVVGVLSATEQKM